MLHQPITAATAQDRETLVRQLAAQHRATLDYAESLTDFPTTLAQIKSARRIVARYADDFDLGMLGRNGIGPQIESIAKSARFHGISGRWS